MIKGVLAYVVAVVVVIGIVFGSSLLAMGAVAVTPRITGWHFTPFVCAFCCGSRCSRTANRSYRYQERF